MIRLRTIVIALSAFATPSVAADVRLSGASVISADIPAETVTTGPTVVTERLRRGPTVTTVEEVTTAETVYYYAPVAYPPRKPYFVVDQGPEFSGPDIVITAITWTDTDQRRKYPFIGRAKPIGWTHHRTWRHAISALGAVPSTNGAPRRVWVRSHSRVPAARSTAAQPARAPRH
jgi:hypothetical protein